MVFILPRVSAGESEENEGDKVEAELNARPGKRTLIREDMFLKCYLPSLF